MGSRRRRSLAIGAAVVAALGLIVGAMLHAPPVRGRILAWATSQLASRYGVILSADRLSYNLVTGGATLTNVRLAARQSPDQPFFTAARVAADVPLAAYTGRLLLDDVAVEGGRLTISIGPDGISNLPGGSGGPPPAEPRRLALRGLHLTDFAFVYDDRARPMRIAASGIDAALEHREVRVFDGATGPFSVRGGVDVQWRDRALRVEPFESRVAFDGQNVSMQDLPVITGLGGVNVSGRLNRVLDELSLELGFDGELDVARAAEWAPPPVPVAGTARVKGTIAGPADAVEIVVRFDAASLSVGTEQALTAGGELLIDRTRLSANRLMAAPQSGGEINAALDVPFGDGPLQLTAAWQGVDARVLLRAANVEVRPIATRLDGDLRFTAGPRRALTMKADLSPFEEGGTTSLAGRVGATVDAAAWTVSHDLRTDGVTVAGRAEGTLDAEAPRRSTLRGPSTLAIDSLAAMDGALAPFGVRVPEALRSSAGSVEAEVTLGGTFAEPAVTLVARAPSFEVPGIGASSVSATVAADMHTVRIAPLAVTHADTEAGGDVTVDLATRVLGGSIRATVPDARALQAAIPERWQLGGALGAEATLGGTLDAPVLDVTLTGPVVEIAGDTFESLASRLRVTDTGIAIESLEVTQDQSGRLHARGRYGFDRSYTLELDGAGISWSGALVGDAESRVTVDGRFQGTGSLDRPMGSGRFGITITGGVAGDLVGQGTLDLDLFGDIARLSANVPALGAFANATVATAAPYDYRGVAVVNRLDLSKAAPLLGVLPDQLAGQVSLTAAVNGAAGSDAPPLVEANVQQVDAQVAGVPLQLFSPATVTWKPGEVTVREFTTRVGAGGTLTAHGTWSTSADTSFSGFFRGEVEDVATAARAFGLDTDAVAKGWLEMTLYGTNDRDDLIASFDITNGSVVAGGVTVTNLTTSAGISGETLTLHAVSGRIDAAKAGGTFTGQGRATIPDLDPLRATGRFALDAATFDAAGVEVKQARPSTIVVEKGVVSVEDVVWEALGSQLALGGSVDFSAGSPALNLTAQGIAALRVLSAFIPGVGVDGTAEVDFRVGGTTAAPDLSGTATLFDAEVALSSPRIVVSSLSGPITLGANRVEFRGLTGSANGGSLTIDGGVVLRGTELADGEIHVQAAGMAIEYPQGLRSEIDALLTYDLGEATPILRGDVRVQRSAYTDPISLAALARANSAATVRPGSGDSALRALRLNISLSTVEDMRVDNNYGRFEAGAQLRIVGTAAQPGMSGQVTLREGGLVYAAGRTFSLSRGTVSFTDLTRIQPDLDVQAVTRVSNLGEVTMTLQGTPDRFEFDLTSEENAPQEEIAMALLGGGATGANALALLSTDLLGATGRQIGLDALRLDRGDVVRDEFREDPSATAQDQTNIVTRLTLSKRLRDDVEFTLSQNLAESGKTTFIVSYFPLANLELRGVSRDDGTQGAGIRHQITFGASAARRTAAPRPVITVTDVRLDGALAPLTEAELRKDLKVAAGDTFDYFDWQQDLDGLTARYVGLGYYEARVRGRRDDAGAGSITVVYAVTPGPASRIVVDGIEVPKDDLEAIREIWTRGVFDRFIVQDAEGHMQRVLLARGFVNGIVTGTMESSSEFKTLRLTVVPGSASGRRSMRFTGNQGIHASELETTVLQWGMAEYGWIDRDLLARTLEGYYRSEGYLTARVIVQAPTLENGDTILPVQIEEGVQATIREVQWSGVSEDHSVASARAADLEAGRPYRLAAVDAARRRVDRRYRSLGYNAAEVGASATPANDGTLVDIRLEVVEGPQQVLQDVETVGATRTREGVVRRALRLPVGEPVDLEEWALARKRLYDTNVFRAVDIQAVPLGDPVGGVQQVRAHVTVEEYPHWRFRYGLQVDRERGDGGDDDPTDLNLGVIAEIRNQNLFGRALTGGASVRAERDYQRANTFVQSPGFLGLPLRSGLFLYTSRDHERVDGDVLFVTDEQGLSFEQRWRRRRGFEITYAYTFENNHVYDPQPLPGDPFPLDQRANIGRLQTALLFDRRTDPMSPTAGTFSAVSFERAASWLGSDVTYGKVLWQQYGFWSVGPVVLASRVLAGHAFGDDLLPDDRFEAGGSTTVRGYAENALGPRDIFGTSALGGNELLVLNQEVRVPVYRWIRGVGFVDVGNVFDANYPFAWSELKVGYGLGLRLDSPIGLLRLDYGIPGSTLQTSRRRANDLSGGRWYFGLGHIF